VYSADIATVEGVSPAGSAEIVSTTVYQNKVYLETPKESPCVSQSELSHNHKA